mmetsp:Transcript_58918/g.138536  ORF Transcript_58918/g.138536 Transcript_58918/m.138536 type:complete len:247 (-) Transcript_58918:268-1008(-)
MCLDPHTAICSGRDLCTTRREESFSEISFVPMWSAQERSLTPSAEASTTCRAYGRCRYPRREVGSKSTAGHMVPRKGLLTRFERRSAVTSKLPSSWLCHTHMRSHPRMLKASQTICWHSSCGVAHVSSIPTADRTLSLTARKSSHGSSSSTSAMIPFGLRCRMTLTIGASSPGLGPLAVHRVMGLAAMMLSLLSAAAILLPSSNSPGNFEPKTSSGEAPKNCAQLAEHARIFWLGPSSMRKKTPCG